MAATRTIDLKTDVPGPRSREVLDRLAASVASPLALTFPVVAAEARGVTITDVDGNTFIDFAGGVGCLNVGHSHPHVVAAAQEQLDRFSHTDFTVVPYEVYATLAERLLALAPFTGPAKAAFFNAGTEAVENAVKFARAYTGRPAVIGFEGALPRPDAALADADLEDAPVQGRARAVRARGLPRAVPERLPRPVGRRGARRARAARSRRVVARRERRRDRLRARAGRGRRSSPRRASSSQGLREICDEHGIVLVVRRGADRLRAHRPLLRDRALRRRAGPDHGRQVDRDGPAALGRARQGGDHGRAGRRRRRRHLRRQPGRPGRRARRARRDRGRGARRALGRDRRDDARPHGGWQARWPQIGDVRGLGSMLAIELVADAERRSRPPSSPRGRRRRRSTRGLLLLKAGVHGNCIRVLVPLVITDAELDEALGVWEDALEAALRSQRRSPGTLAPMVGEVLSDRYELEELVGYRRHVERLSRARPAARPQGRAEGPAPAATARTTTTSSASGARRGSVAALSHPNIVTVIDRGEHEGRQFIVFEYVDGREPEAR